MSTSLAPNSFVKQVPIFYSFSISFKVEFKVTKITDETMSRSFQKGGGFLLTNRREKTCNTLIPSTLNRTHVEKDRE